MSSFNNFTSTVYVFSNESAEFFYEYQSGVSSRSCDLRSQATIIVVATREQVSILWYRYNVVQATMRPKFRIVKIWSEQEYEPKKKSVSYY